MTTVFARNGRLLALAMFMIIVAGLAALAAIARQEDPAIVNRVALVLTPFPGATAERVEALVTDRIEDGLREIAEVDTISSDSRNGLSTITVEVLETLTETEVDEAFSRIRDALSDVAADLPAGAGDPAFDDERGYAYTALVALRWTAGGDALLGVLGRHAEELRSRLRSVPYTELVRIYGAPDEEITATVDPDALAAAGLTVETVANALLRADAKVAAGQLRGSDTELAIEVTGELDSLARIEEVPIVRQDSGAILRVGDVATVERSAVDPPSDLVLVDGSPAVVIAARIEPNRRVDRWSDDLAAALADFDTQLPVGVELDVRFDQAHYTEARLTTLVGNLLIGAGIVVSVLFVTLGWRAALIVTAALPLSSLATLAVLNGLGIPIHQMSVTGLIVALGLLVDNAIVVTDAIRARRARGEPVIPAVAATLRRLWLPLLSSTATTVLAFMPIVLLPGAVGEFVGAIGVSVVVSLISSYLLAMTIVPALAGRLLKPLPTGTGTPRWWRAGITLPALARLFAGSLRLALAHPRLSIMAASVVPVLGIVGATTLTEQFFPTADRDQFHIEMRLPSQASIHETRDVARRAYDLLMQHDAVQAVDWYIGTSAPSFYYNLTMNQDGVASYAQAQVQVRSIGDVGRLIPVLQAELDQALPEAQILVRELNQGPPFDAPVELRIYGPDLDMLRDLGERARLSLSSVPTVTHTRATLEAGEPKLWLIADEDGARQSGLTLTDIARQLDGSLEGTVAGSMLEGTEELPIRVRVGAADRGNLDAIGAINLIGSGVSDDRFPGIPLSALGEIALSPALGGISRRNGERVNIVRGYIQASTLPETALTAFSDRLAADPLALPPGYRVEFGGETAERDDAVGNLMASVGPLMVLMVAFVVLTFNSFRMAGLIFIVAGQAFGLGLFSVTVFDYALGFVVIIGLMGLVGLAINASIIILSAIKADARAASGDPRRIVEVVVDETSRHIFSTTITTTGGFIPLLLSDGFWPPFAAAIAGGTLLSAIVSFYFVLPAYLLLNRLTTRPADAAIRPALAAAG